MSLHLRLGLLYGGMSAAVLVTVSGLTVVAHRLGHPELLVHAIVALAAAGAVTALGLGWLLAGRALRPVAIVTETADAIARSRNFGLRVPAVARQDELGRLAATFNGMLGSLERAYAAEQRFVSDASHELRAPLTVIQANLDLLERRQDLAAGAREAVGEAARETRRLGVLVAELLALARADAGVPLQRRLVELDRVLLDAFGEARHLARGHQLTLGELQPAVVEGDDNRLKQLFLILLDNALKYTPGGGRVTVSLTRRAADGAASAEVTVQDTGIGIPPEHLPHVFDRFYRADPGRSRDPGGSGLGLAIAQWIAREHGGVVTLASEPGNGTRAAVTLPLPG